MFRNKDGGIRFKNLHLFNMGKLAKQGWRILRNLESLIAKLKAMRFPHGNFIKEELGEQSSCIPWCSIWQAREAFDGRLVVVKTLIYGEIAGYQILTSDSIYTSTKRSTEKGI